MTPVRIVFPGRTAVEEYDILKREIERRTGKIDGAFTDVGRVPIRYIPRSLNGEERPAPSTGPATWTRGRSAGG